MIFRTGRCSPHARLVSQSSAASAPIIKVLQARWRAGSSQASGWFKVMRILTVPSSSSSNVARTVTIGITVGLFTSNLAIYAFRSLLHLVRGKPPRRSRLGSGAF